MPGKISDEIKAKCGCAFPPHCCLFLEVLHFAFVFVLLYSVSVAKSLVAFRPDEKVSPLTASLFSRVALCTRTHCSSSSWQFGQLDFFLVEAW